MIKNYKFLKENQNDLQYKNSLYQKYLSVLKQFEETDNLIIEHGFLKKAENQEDFTKMNPPGTLYAYITWREISQRSSRSQYIHKFFLDKNGSTYHNSYFDKLLSGIEPSSKINFY